MSIARVERARYRRFRPAVPVARARARSLADGWGISEVADSLEWAVAELVTNAITHGRAPRGSQVLVTYQLTQDFLRVEVRDWASGTPRLNHAALDNSDLPEGGRGLAIVATLAERWGVIPHVIGKSIWFEIKISTPSEETP